MKEARCESCQQRLGIDETAVDSWGRYEEINTGLKASGKSIIIRAYEKPEGLFYVIFEKCGDGSVEWIGFSNGKHTRFGSSALSPMFFHDVSREIKEHYQEKTR